MDSKHEALKRQVENCYKTIKVANKELKKIRETECEHPEVELVNYMWAPGHYMSDTEVCLVCGEVIGTPYDNITLDVKTADSADLEK